MGMIQKVNSCLSPWICVLEDVVHVVFLFRAKIVIIASTPNSTAGFIDEKVSLRASDEAVSEENA